MKSITVFIACVLVAGNVRGQEQEHKGAMPEPKGDAWLKLHMAFVEEAGKGGIDVLFLGDSITDGWRLDPAKKIWDERFAPLKAANFGISGDRTQHVLWRIQAGEMDGITPKVVVLMIGTNNIGQRDPEPTASAAAGVKAIVEEVLKKSPKTKVLLLAVFPKAEKAGDYSRTMVKELNDAIAKLDDGGKTVRYLDIGAKFLSADGSISKEVMPDFLHLSGKGYQIWADAIKEPLGAMLK